MNKILLSCLTIILVSSCRKDIKEPDAGPFFISYTVQDVNFYISPGNDYLLSQGTDIAADAVNNHQFFPTTRFFPANPHNENIYHIGFLFSSAQTGSDIDWVAIGNSIFRQKEYTICYTGVNYSNYLEGLACSGATVYYTPENGKLLNSASVVQPAGNYFIIDTVTNFHSTDTRPYYDFDKIISGRFQCRVFNPENHTEYADLTMGKFRMPVWKNGFR